MQRIFSIVLNACLQIHNYTNRTLNSKCIFAIIVQDVLYTNQCNTNEDEQEQVTAIRIHE